MFLVGLQADNGVLLGAVGKTEAEAVAGVVEALGEDFEELYAEGLRELALKGHEVAQEQADPLPQPSAVAAPVAAGGAGAVGGVAGAGPDDDERPGDPGGGGAEPPAPPEPTEPRAEQGGGGAGDSEPDQLCAVCAATITAARAEISVEDYGQPQCKQCSPR